MIEFSRIKKVTIKEGIVNKITNSSGVVLWKAANDTSGDTSSVTVDLNNQWVASTKKLDGYAVFMSNSNKGVGGGYASMKFKFKGKPDFKIWINSYAESSYDYTIAFNMDVDYPTSYPDYNSTGVKLHTRGFQKNPTTIDNFKEVDYPNDGGEHFVVVTYRKDDGGNNADDRGYVAIKGALLSTSWVVSSTEFIKENDKYYQIINEIETYEGGIVAPTGNFKAGNELTPTYIQSSDASDYMVVGSGIYYKKYAWITPVDTAINTGDYIQGDYIGVATPSMKVIYKDNTEKTFYNLTSIEQDTDANKVNAKNVEIYDGVTSIGSGAFQMCGSITSITLSNSIISIEGFAFYANGISSIVIHSSTKNIGSWAFRYCSSLSSVTIENSSSKLAYNEYAFADISSSARLYVPSSLLADYQSDTAWTDAFKGGIYAITPSMKVTYADNTEKTFYNLTSIEIDTDENKANAKNVEIYDLVTKIGDQAFSRCYGLSAITIPDSVTSIGYSSFYGCRGLTSLTIPSGVTSISGYAFYGCRGLTSLTIPSGVTSISNNAFNYNANLESVTIENSTSKVVYYNNAFANISSSAKLYVPSNLLADYQADEKWTGAFPGGIYAIPDTSGREIGGVQSTPVD